VVGYHTPTRQSRCAIVKRQEILSLVCLLYSLTHSSIDPQHHPDGVAHKLAVTCQKLHAARIKTNRIKTARALFPLLVSIWPPTFSPILAPLLGGLPLLFVRSNQHTDPRERPPKGQFLSCIVCTVSLVAPLSV
jgi:hypothetical protein